MDNDIKITSDLDIRFSDLMRTVDPSHEFTLRDVLRATVSSTEISIEIMQRLLHCSCIEDYYKEAQSKPFENTKDIDYLELYLLGDIYEDIDSPDGICCSSQWAFHGVGKLGVLPEDSYREITDEEKTNFRECYAVEFSPLYQLSDYKIKFRKEIMISNQIEEDYLKQINRVKFQPSITLIEVLYWIFWEISFLGSPSDREKENAELKRRIDEIDQAKKDGTLDKIMIPWEEVKENIKNKCGVVVENKENDKMTSLPEKST